MLKFDTLSGAKLDRTQSFTYIFFAVDPDTVEWVPGDFGQVIK